MVLLNSILFEIYQYLHKINLGPIFRTNQAFVNEHPQAQEICL